MKISVILYCLFVQENQVLRDGSEVAGSAGTINKALNRHRGIYALQGTKAQSLKPDNKII